MKQETELVWIVSNPEIYFVQEKAGKRRDSRGASWRTTYSHSVVPYQEREQGEGRKSSGSIRAEFDQGILPRVLVPPTT